MSFCSVRDRKRGKKMTLKLLDKNKWRHGGFRRFEDCRRRGSSRVDEFREAGRTNSNQNVEFLHGKETGLAVMFGFAGNAPRAGSSHRFGRWSILMAMNKKPGWRTLAGRFNQYQALVTLTGDRSLEHKEKRTSYAMQMDIVKALHKGERCRASDLLQKHVQTKHSSRADKFGLIFNYCARTTDPLFAMETWRSFDERKIRIKRNFCKLMIQTLCKGGYLEEGLNMLGYLGENRGVYPMLDVYNYFLRACLKRKNAVYASKCLDQMEQRLVGKNEHTYLELLKLAVLQKNWDAVHEIWKDYIKHYPANIPLMRYFLVSYIELRDLKAAYEMLQLMVSCAVRGAAFGVHTVNGRLSFPKFDIPIPSKNGLSLKRWASGEVSHCSEEVDGLGVGTTFLLSERNIVTHKSVYPILGVLRSSFNDLIHACTQARDYSLAEELFQQMLNLGLEPAEETYDGLVKAVIYREGFTAGIEVLKTMQKRNLKPRKGTLATLSKGCSIALELDLAEVLLNQLTRCPYPYPYNALLQACTNTNELERAVRVLAKMKQAMAKPDIKTYELLFCLFGNVNPPYETGNLFSQSIVAKRIKAIEADMVENGVQHSSKSIRNLLRALGYEGMTEEVIRYLHLAEDLFSRNNKQLGTPVYNTVLYALTAAEDSLMAIDMFKSMRKCGLPLNDVTYNIMIDCCSNIQCFRSATALVSLMIRDGYVPHTMTYTALIKILLDDKKYDEALYLLDLACSDSNEIDTLLFNTILKKSGEEGRIDLLEFIIEHMRRVNVGPDASTCSYVCATYTDKKCERTAMEALQVLSVRMIIQEGIPSAEKRVEYEDFIYSEDPEAESQISYLLEDYQDNVAFGLLNLRWCAILGLMDSVNWVPEESPWSRTISSNYEDLMGMNYEGKGHVIWKDREIGNNRKGKRFVDYGNERG